MKSVEEIYQDNMIKMVLASSSKLFLEGIRKILEDEGNIKIAEVSNCEEIEKCLTEIEPEFLFLDNRTLNLDIHKLLNLITKKSFDTKVILFISNHTRVPIGSPSDSWAMGAVVSHV